MSTYVNGGEQSTAEIRTYYCDFSPDLPEGATVISATATHIPPQGGTVRPCTTSLVTPVITVTLPNPVEVGQHFISVLAHLSNGEISEIRISINVRF